jgi:hypothetical protein
VQEVLQNLPARPAIERVSAAAGIVLMTGGASAVWAFDPTTIHILPICPLYALTGFACPGCGLTRGFHALFHGDVVTALDFNALIPIWTAVFVYLFFSLVMTTVRGRGLSWKFLTPSTLVGFLVLLLTFGVLRNLPYYPFTILFP